MKQLTRSDSSSRSRYGPSLIMGGGGATVASTTDVGASAISPSATAPLLC
jgi:hypothetical protein